MHAAAFLPTYPPHTFDPLTLSTRDFYPPNPTAHSYMPSTAHAAPSSASYGYHAYSVEGRFSGSTASYSNAQPSSLSMHSAGTSTHYRYSQAQLQSLPSLQPIAAHSWQQSRPSSLAHSSSSLQLASSASIMPPASERRETRRSPQGEAERAPQAAILYEQSRVLPHGSSLSSQRGSSAYSSSTTRLPPILQVEKQTVTTSATQAASASRRRNEANFQCPVPGCGSTFTRRFNLRGLLLFQPHSPRRVIVLISYVTRFRASQVAH
jgi:hypothetical protein